jgi:hypothetical protein
MTKNPPLDEPEDPTPSHSPIPADETTSYRTSPPPHPLPLAITDEPAQPEPSQRNPQSDEAEAGGVEVHSLDLGDGNVVKLDKLGPMIINSDGVGDIPSYLDEAHGRSALTLPRLSPGYRTGTSCTQLRGNERSGCS